MKIGLLAAALAVLATSPATAQEVFASRGGGARLNSEVAPDEQRDPNGYYAYMVRQGYCADSGGLHPGWHACVPGETNGSRAINSDQTQRVQRRYDGINNDPRLGLGNEYARSQGFRPLEAGPPQRNAGTGVRPFSRSFLQRPTYNNGTNFYPGYEPRPGTIVQRPPQFGMGTIVRPRAIVRPKGFLLPSGSSRAAK